MAKLQKGDRVVIRAEGRRGTVTEIDPENALCRVTVSGSNVVFVGSEDELDVLELEDEAGSLD
jgi:ribosomal protein L24